MGAHRQRARRQLVALTLALAGALTCGIVGYGAPATALASHDGDAITKLWAPANVRAYASPSAATARHYSSMSAWPDQDTHSAHAWQYVKAIRTTRGDLPASWYAVVAGRRVRDKGDADLYVMRPDSSGWRAYVNQQCGGERCFIDSAGVFSWWRTTPRMPITLDAYATAMRDLLAQLDGPTLANSLGYAGADPLNETISAGPEYLATEGWTATLANTRWLIGRDAWVSMHRPTAEACNFALAAYLLGRGRTDRFSCHVTGTAPWQGTRLMYSAPLGAGNAMHRLRPWVWVRSFDHGSVTVDYAAGTYTIDR